MPEHTTNGKKYHKMQKPLASLNEKGLSLSRKEDRAHQSRKL